MGFFLAAYSIYSISTNFYPQIGSDLNLTYTNLEWVALFFIGSLTYYATMVAMSVLLSYPIFPSRREPYRVEIERAKSHRAEITMKYQNTKFRKNTFLLFILVIIVGIAAKFILGIENTVIIYGTMIASTLFLEPSSTNEGSDKNMNQDIVARLPTKVALYEIEHGKLPDNLELDPGSVCIYGDEYFIHTRATLPLKSTKDGIGFGLWVEVDKDTFIRYYDAQDNDDLYKNFRARGKLANDWPGFQNTYGVEVTIRTISLKEKVYITEVHMDKPRDPLFEAALNTQAGDQENIEMIKNLVKAYITDSQYI